MKNVLDVAAYLITKASNKRGVKKDFTPLKLQKILYYAQGWHLANYGEPLFESKICAWKYGPVVKAVYNYYKGRPTHISLDEMPGDPANLDQRTTDFLDVIWDQYGNKSAWELVGMTHLTKPWIDASEDPLSDEISNDEIKDYFSSIKP